MSAVILSLCYQFDKLGAAYYDETSAKVYLLQDMPDDYEFETVSKVLREVKPSITIVSKVQEPALVDFLDRLTHHDVSYMSEKNVKEEPHCEAGDDGKVNEEIEESESDDSEAELESDLHFSFALHLMPKIAFDFENAKKRIAVLYEKFILNKEENYLKFALQINVAAVNMVRAFGALLKYLDAIRLGVEFEDYSKQTPIVAVEVLSIDQTVEMDAASFEALQIFQKDSRSSVAKTVYSKAHREGVSLFRICNRCKSKPGRLLLKRWFECPTLNRQTLFIRQETISFFVQDCNADSMNYIFSRIKRISSLKGILKRAKGGRMTINDWKNFYTTCSNILQVKDYISKRELPLEEIAGELRNHVEKVARLSALIAEIIDFRESNSENRVVMNRGVNEELDKLKDGYRQLPEWLTKVAREEADRLNVEVCSVGYVPMFGYLLELPTEIDVSCHIGTDLQLVYELPEEKIKHYKSSRMHELDEQIGDIKMEIFDIETTTTLRSSLPSYGFMIKNCMGRCCIEEPFLKTCDLCTQKLEGDKLFYASEKMLCRYAHVLSAAVHICATLECCISLALTAREYDWHRPVLVEEAVLDVDKARHPVAELLSDTKFVPNPIRSGCAQTKVKLIIGPNASGKSVYLKQVGLIVFLAHIGSFVPAERAVIGPVDCILTRLYSVDCVLDGLSSFAKDIAQMAACLRRSTGNSLIIIDEFGKGTLTEVGLSLLASSLNFWIDRGKSLCPHIFISSHFLSLTNFLHNDPDLLSYHTMEVVQKNGELEFQYQLVDGIIDYSFAIYTAEAIGIPKSVVIRSLEVFQSLRSEKSIELLKEDIKEATFLKQLEPLSEIFLKWDLANDSKGFLCKAADFLSGKNIDTLQETEDTRIETVKTNEEISDLEEINVTSKCGSDNKVVARNESITEANVDMNIPQLVEDVAISGSTSVLKRKRFDQSRQTRNVSFRSPVIT